MTDRATTVSAAHKTRGEAMMAAIDAIQAELEPGETANLIACQGEPICSHRGDDGLPADCPNCTRMTIGAHLPSA